MQTWWEISRVSCFLHISLSRPPPPGGILGSLVALPMGGPCQERANVCTGALTAQPLGLGQVSESGGQLENLDVHAPIEGISGHRKAPISEVSGGAAALPPPVCGKSLC